jgi:hypothetical protein
MTLPFGWSDGLALIRVKVSGRTVGRKSKTQVGRKSVSL